MTWQQTKYEAQYIFRIFLRSSCLMHNFLLSASPFYCVCIIHFVIYIFSSITKEHANCWTYFSTNNIIVRDFSTFTVVSLWIKLLLTYTFLCIFLYCAIFLSIFYRFFTRAFFDCLPVWESSNSIVMLFHKTTVLINMKLKWMFFWWMSRWKRWKFTENSGKGFCENFK